MTLSRATWFGIGAVAAFLAAISLAGTIGWPV